MKLQELKELAKAATPGPWVYAYEYTSLVTEGKHPGADVLASSEGKGWYCIDLDSGVNDPKGKSGANGVVSAAARNHIEELIERVEKLAGALKEISEVKDYGDITVISVLDYEWDFKQQRGLAAAGDIARNAIALYGPDKELG